MKKSSKYVCHEITIPIFIVKFQPYETVGQEIDEKVVQTRLTVDQFDWGSNLKKVLLDEFSYSISGTHSNDRGEACTVLRSSCFGKHDWDSLTVEWFSPWGRRTSSLMNKISCCECFSFQWGIVRNQAISSLNLAVSYFICKVTKSFV